MKVEKAKAIQAALAKANNIVDRAVPILADLMRKNPKLYRAMCDPFVEGIARDELNAQVRQDRYAIARVADKGAPPSSGPTPGPGARNGDTIRDMTSMSLLMFPLPGGKCLRDARYSDCSVAMGRFEKQATTMAFRRNFLGEVRKGLAKDDSNTGGDVYTDAALQKIWDRT